MVLKFQYEHLHIMVSMMDNEESNTYCYSWITIMISKKTEDIQWVTAVKFQYVVVILEPCGRQFNWCLLAAVMCLRHSSKDTVVVLMLSKLSWRI
jgi:hypothetical protein